MYGWDSEYGHATEEVKEFKASKFLVSNLEYLEFVEDGGYDTKQYWTEEGWKWNRSTEMKHPIFWIRIPDDHHMGLSSTSSSDDDKEVTSNSSFDNNSTPN